MIKFITGFTAVLIVLAVATLVVKNQKPQIELGVDHNKLREIPNKPNAVSTETRQADKLIKALPLKQTLGASKAAMKEALAAYGGIEIKAEADNYIYAVATTATLKFHDDIEIYFDQANNRVQYRSASRAGYSDGGLNRARYQIIAAAYQNSQESI